MRRALRPPPPPPPPLRVRSSPIPHFLHLILTESRPVWAENTSKRNSSAVTWIQSWITAGPMWPSFTESQLMSGITKIGQQSLIMELFFFFPPERKQRRHLFSTTRAVKAVLYKTGQGPINGCEPVVMGSHKFSPSPTLKRKAYLLPSWCLHYYLAVPPGSDRTRPPSQGASSQQPLPARLIQCP